MNTKRIGLRQSIPIEEPEDNETPSLNADDSEIDVKNADLDFVIKEAAVRSQRADAMTLAAIREEKRKIEELRKRLFGI